VTGVNRWMGKYCKPHFSAGVGRRFIKNDDESERRITFQDWPTLPIRIPKEIMERAINSREIGLRYNPNRPSRYTTHVYFRSGFSIKTNLTKARIYCAPFETRGIMEVIKFRIGAIVMAPELAHRKTNPEEFKERCPFCETEGPETIHHFIF
jgi:hypothetical protein